MENTLLVTDREVSSVAVHCSSSHQQEECFETSTRISPEILPKEIGMTTFCKRSRNVNNSQGQIMLVNATATRTDVKQSSVCDLNENGKNFRFANPNNGCKEIRCLENAERGKDIDKRFLEGGVPCKGGVPSYQNRGRGLRPHSTPATLLWLEENYEMAEGVCIPRNTLYQHYVDFCARQGLHPVNAASFGKIIRQQFPGLTTRRLGTRGQSRYHYYGIAIREGSKYYEVHYSRRGNSGCLDAKKEGAKQFNVFQCRGNASMLPEFPSLKDLCLPNSVSKDKVLTFMMMYRTHCQRILDSVSRVNFDEIQSFIHHFWREIPVHLIATLGSNSLVCLVGVCDAILYRTICNVLMPSVLQEVPDRVTQLVRKFAHNFDAWLQHSLSHLPDNLKTVKIVLGQRFSRMLRRQTSLNHLCQAARMVLHSPEITNQMLQDWRQLDLEAVAQQTLYANDKQTGGLISLQLIRSLYREFERLLDANSPLETFCSWLKGLVDRCVTGASRRSKLSFFKIAHSFLDTWTTFGSHLIRDMTIHSFPSFGSFHLLHMTFDGFMMYLVEGLHSDDRAKEMLSCISLDAMPDLSDLCFDTEPNDGHDGNLPGISLLLGHSANGSSSATDSRLSSSAVPQVPLVTSSTAPGMSPNSQSNSDLNASSDTVLDGMEVVLPNDERSNMEYNNLSSNSASGALASHSATVSITTTSGVDSSSPSSVINDGYSLDAANYYCYEYDHRGYKMSTVVGRNYIYPGASSFNQYCSAGPVPHAFTGGTREERCPAGINMEALHYPSGGRVVDASYTDASSTSFADQSLLYSSNYHYQAYDNTDYVQKCKHRVAEN